MFSLFDSRFRRRLIERLLQHPFPTPHGYLDVDQIEISRPLLSEQIRVRFGFEGSPQEHPDINELLKVLNEQGQVAVRNEWRPGRLLYFTFSNRYSVEKNLAAFEATLQGIDVRRAEETRTGELGTAHA
jgi:hypothetical protein